MYPIAARNATVSAQVQDVVCDYILRGLGGSLKASGLGDGGTQRPDRFSFVGQAIPKASGFEAATHGSRGRAYYILPSIPGQPSGGSLAGRAPFSSANSWASAGS